jgi:DNA polymerase III subunit gamma/tau
MNLANKYRPNKIDEIIHQQVPCAILRKHITDDKMQPAYLFVGGAGCGKTSLARIVANEISTNIVEIDGASNNSIDNVRVIIDDAQMNAIGGGRKVYIVDEVHMLSTSAFNALLKILEEPPTHVVFILCTTEMHKVPQTIQSRCMYLRFDPIPMNKIYERLKYILECEGIKEYEDEALKQIAKMANGGMRKGISLLDRLISYNQGITIESLKLVGMESYSIYYDSILEICNNKNCKPFIQLISTQNMYKLKDTMWEIYKVCVDTVIYHTMKSWENIVLPKTSETKNFFEHVDIYMLQRLINQYIDIILEGMYQYTENNLRNIIVYKIIKFCDEE